MAAPIFYDPTGRRSRWSKRAVAALLVLVIAVAVGFATTLLAVVPGRSLSLPLPQLHPAPLHGTGPHGLARWLPRRSGTDPKTPLTVGFYVPGDDASAASLVRNVGALDWVVPGLLYVAGPAHTLSVTADKRFDHAIAAMRHPPKILPMVQNFRDGGWAGANTATLLRDGRARPALATRLGGVVAARHDAGLMMDMEELPRSAQRDYLLFLRQLRRALPRGALLAVTVPADDPDWPLAAYGRVADRVVFMAYDQHWDGGPAGPIAAQDWFVSQVENARRAIGRAKLVVALGSRPNVVGPGSYHRRRPAPTLNRLDALVAARLCRPR